jgi:phosphoribosylaminoimidazole-succinocarboxamide synthase
MEALKETAFTFEGQTGFYRGKVRDVYYFGNMLIAVATDRISAFDVILPSAIPHKGAILNGIAAQFLNESKALVPNWLTAVPDPQVSVGVRAEPFPVEMVVRGYLVGHAWRTYQSGLRQLCGVSLPDGLRENDALPSPIITPTTKAHAGHDEDVSRSQILAQGLVSEAHYSQLEHYSLALYALGQQQAASKGLILADTKYEFGLDNDAVILIDEAHTPDSSRYFYLDGFDVRQSLGQPQRQLSKEFVRQWLLQEGFSGQEGQVPPPMDAQKIAEISERYQELYNRLTGKSFVPPNSELSPSSRIQAAIEHYLAQA